MASSHLHQTRWAILPWVSPSIYISIDQLSFTAHLHYLGTGATGGGVNWVGYLTTADNDSLVLSYNLAVGGATIDNDIINAGVEDMTTQVATWQSTYSSKPGSAPWGSDTAVFGFWIGINEYVMGIQDARRETDHVTCSVGWDYSSTDASKVVPTLMAQYASLVEGIYASGGRKFLFVNVPPTSRSPYILSSGEAASEEHAAWLQVFNEGLSSMVDRFRANHSDVRANAWYRRLYMLIGYRFKRCSTTPGVL